VTVLFASPRGGVSRIYTRSDYCLFAFFLFFSFFLFSFWAAEKRSGTTIYRRISDKKHVISGKKHVYLGQKTRLSRTKNTS